jgi:hypothetical protein
MMQRPERLATTTADRVQALRAVLFDLDGVFYAEETLMVGDNPKTDIAGARRTGLMTALIDPAARGPGPGGPGRVPGRVSALALRSWASGEPRAACVRT